MKRQVFSKVSEVFHQWICVIANFFINHSISTGCSSLIWLETCITEDLILNWCSLI